MIDVLIADDHTTVRKGLVQLIAEQPDMRIVGEAVNGYEALNLLRQSEAHVLVLDISMPIRSGMEVLQEARRSRPKLAVLILSVYPEEQFAIRALKAGAAGYMAKDAAIEMLIPAIQKLASGGRYVSPHLAEIFALEASNESKKLPHELLTDREYDVMRMIGIGKPPGTIATELALSSKTISTYRSRVLHKLKLKSNAELIRYVMEHNLG